MCDSVWKTHRRGWRGGQACCWSDFLFFCCSKCCFHFLLLLFDILSSAKMCKCKLGDISDHSKSDAGRFDAALHNNIIIMKTWKDYFIKQAHWWFFKSVFQEIRNNVHLLSLSLFSPLSALLLILPNQQVLGRKNLFSCSSRFQGLLGPLELNSGHEWSIKKYKSFILHTR